MTISVCASYLLHTIRGSRNQYHRKTPSWLTAAAVSTHPDQTTFVASDVTLLRQLFVIPTTRRSTLGDRAFSAAAARAWNTLPSTLRSVPSLTTSRRHLKTELLTFLFFGHVERMHMSLDITRALQVSIRGLAKDWRRPPGSPLHTWLHTLDADLQPHNFGLNSAWKYAQDQEHWKHLAETAMLQLVACA